MQLKYNNKYDIYYLYLLYLLQKGNMFNKVLMISFIISYSFNFLDIKPNNSVNVTSTMLTNFMHKAFLHSIVVYEDEKKPKLSGASDVMDTPWNIAIYIPTSSSIQR